VFKVRQDCANQALERLPGGPTSEQINPNIPSWY
jgi:hypothetical protein